MQHKATWSSSHVVFCFNRKFPEKTSLRSKRSRTTRTKIGPREKWGKSKKVERANAKKLFRLLQRTAFSEISENVTKKKILVSFHPV